MNVYKNINRQKIKSHIWYIHCQPVKLGTAIYSVYVGMLSEIDRDHHAGTL